MIKRITDRKFFNEYINGTSFAVNTGTFATTLRGSILERQKTTYQIEVGHTVDSNDAGGVSFNYLTGDILSRSFGSFVDEGWFITQSVEFFNHGTSLIEFTADILWITETQVGLTNITGSPVEGKKPNHIFFGVDAPQFIYQRFNFVENSDDEEFDDKGYYGGVGALTPLEPNKSWQDGSAVFAYNGSVTPLADGSTYIHSYTIDHIFIVPYFIDDYRQNYSDRTLPPPFLNTNSPKYIVEFSIRYQENNPNDFLTVSDFDNLGSLGWYNENNNSNLTLYTVSDVDYFPKTQLSVSEVVTVTFIINGTGFTAATKVGAYHGYLPSILDPSKDFLGNYFWDNIFCVADNAPVLGANQIQTITATLISSTQIDVTMDILATPAIAENGYTLAFQVGSDIDTRSMIQIDTQGYLENTDIAGLLTFGEMTHYREEMNISDAGKTDYDGFVEDGIVTKFSFDLDKVDETDVNTLHFQFIAYNPSNERQFVIQEFNFDLSSQTIVNTTPSYQAIAIDDTRGFNLADGDQFNLLKLTTTDITANLQNWSGVFAWRVDWQKWEELGLADTIFFDASKQLNGLNKNSSNYKGNGYELRVSILVDVVKNNVTTTYRQLSPEILIADYDSTTWTQEVKTFDEDAVDLGGIILSNKPTIFQIDWIPAAPTVVPNGWAHHSLQLGNDIWRLSTVSQTFSSNKMENEGSGAPLLRFETLVDRIRTTAKIKAGAVQPNQCYRLSGRLGEEIVVPEVQLTVTSGGFDNPTWTLNIKDDLAPIANGEHFALQLFVDGVKIASAKLIVGQDITDAAGIVGGSDFNWLTGTTPIADYLPSPTIITAAQINGVGADLIFNKIKWAKDTFNLGVNLGKEIDWVSANTVTMLVRKNAIYIEARGYTSTDLQANYMGSLNGYLDLIDFSGTFINSVTRSEEAVNGVPIFDMLGKTVSLVGVNTQRVLPLPPNVNTDTFTKWQLQNSPTGYPDTIINDELSHGISFTTSSNGRGIYLEVREKVTSTNEYEFRFFTSNFDAAAMPQLWDRGINRGTNVGDRSDTPGTRTNIYTANSSINGFGAWFPLIFPAGEGEWNITCFQEQPNPDAPNVNFESGNNATVHGDGKFIIFSY